MSLQIDWAAVEEKATGMSREQLCVAIADCLDALPYGDALDIAGLTGMGHGGSYYRDEISVYRAELKRREQ